jgi:hypothetical protein
LLLAVALRGYGRRALAVNGVYLLLNQAMWRQNQPISERQAALGRAATLAGWSFGSSPPAPAEPCSFMPALLRAEYHRRQKDWSPMAGWLQQAAVAPPLPAGSPTIGLPGWVELDEAGNLVLGWSLPAWGFRQDSQEADVMVSDGRLTLAYPNQLDQRDVVIYAWSSPIPIHYWHTLQVRARVQEGTFFTLSVATAAGDTRYLDYFTGNGQWQDFTFPINDDQVRYIYLSLGEPTAEAAAPAYQIELEPLKFILDEGVNNCP